MHGDRHQRELPERQRVVLGDGPQRRMLDERLVVFGKRQQCELPRRHWRMRGRR
jgi:hypothetical protein